MIQGVPRGAGNGIAGGREKEAAVEKKKKKEKKILELFKWWLLAVCKVTWFITNTYQINSIDTKWVLGIYSNF